VPDSEEWKVYLILDSSSFLSEGYYRDLPRIDGKQTAMGKRAWNGIRSGTEDPPYTPPARVVQESVGAGQGGRRRSIRIATKTAPNTVVRKTRPRTVKYNTDWTYKPPTRVVRELTTDGNSQELRRSRRLRNLPPMDGSDDTYSTTTFISETESGFVSTAISDCGGGGDVDLNEAGVQNDGRQWSEDDAVRDGGSDTAASQV